MVTDTYTLLAHCARADWDESHSRRLAEAAATFADWEALPAAAEAHGLGPLTYVRLRAAGVETPRRVERELQGLYLRHRHANGVRARALAEVLDICQAAGIRVLVVKGGALAHLLYAEPALRPMSDLDLLVGRADVERVRELLAARGFSAPSSGAKPFDKSLPTAIHPVEGVWVGVEVHSDLFEGAFRASLTMDDLSGAPLPFRLGTDGPTAYTLGAEDMLAHLCWHLIFHTTVFQPQRLIWAADIVGVAERFAAQMDWPRLHERQPVVRAVLALLHPVVPLSDGLLRRAGLPVERTVRGVGVDFQGWPRSAMAVQRRKGWLRVLRDTFFPSEWWLRLHYGLAPDRPLFGYRWLRHPLEIAGRVRQLWRERRHFR